eukprot:881383_1
MEDHQITSQSTNNNTHKPYSQLYKQLVFTNLKLNHSPQNATINTLKERILYILDEIQRQDVGETHTGPPSDKVIETKTQDYYYNSESYSKQTDSQLTPSKEKERLLQVQELKRTNAYQTIMDLYQPQLQSLLRHKNNSYKTKPELFLECGNKQCKLQIDITPFECQNTTDAVSCEPLKRLEVMLAVYKELKEQDTLWRKVPIADILYVKDLYGYQQLCNDWLHVKIVHIDGDPDKDTPNAMARRLCTRYAENPKWSCSHLSNCAGYQRHYRDRTNDQLEQQLYFRRSVRATLNKTERILNNKDIVYQQECDKIHSFLLHSTIKWGTSLNRTKFKPTPTCETQTSNISKHSEGRSCSFSKEMLIGSTQQLELPLAIEEQTETSAIGSYIGMKEDDDGWRYSNEGSWNASMIRSIFFSVHLFREQMFSVSHHLESHLKAFLQQISPLEYDIDEDKLKQTTEYLEDVIHNRNRNISSKANAKNNERKRKIFKILWEKFDEFRQEPNMEQIIKIDTISDGLKPYFLDESSAKDIHNKRILWDISFDKILALFPNAQEIHFLNQYTLNNVALKRLIRQIKKPKNKLKRVKFLYYEYNEVPTESSYFYPPDSLKEDSIQELTNGMRTDDNQLKKWKFVKSETKNVGYKIRLYEVSDPNEPYRIASRQTRRHSLTINKTH